ncbi:MAG: PrgI family protein [Patescibacteria group bacterium]|nr:PrgI family protein [Patescibacteria group bacterium]
MQQFTVPQFIDVESKIIGPITTRQFLIFLGAAIIIGISYKIFDFALFLTVAIVIFAVAGTFAFLKINGRPFHFFVLNLIQTWRRPNLRVWNHILGFVDSPDAVIVIKEEKQIPTKEVFKSSHLADLALVVDTKGRYRGGDDEQV